MSEDILKEYGVKINTLKGEKTLVYPLRELKKLQDKYGDLYKIMNIMKEPKLDDFIFIVYIGLLHENPEIKEDEILDLFLYADIAKGLNKVAQALTKSTVSPNVSTQSQGGSSKKKETVQ